MWLRICIAAHAAVVVPNKPRPPREQSATKSDVAVTIEWDAPVYVRRLPAPAARCSGSHSRYARVLLAGGCRSSGPPIDKYEVSYRVLGLAKWVVVRMPHACSLCAASKQASKA